MITTCSKCFRVYDDSKRVADCPHLGLGYPQQQQNREMEKTVDRVTVGRIVHYVLPENSAFAGHHRAAVVAQVLDVGAEAVNLSVAKGQDCDFSLVVCSMISESQTHALIG